MNETVDTPVDRLKAALIREDERHERALLKIRRDEFAMKIILAAVVALTLAAAFFGAWLGRR